LRTVDPGTHFHDGNDYLQEVRKSDGTSDDGGFPTVATVKPPVMVLQTEDRLELDGVKSLSIRPDSYERVEV
jgi:hypothetical protein